MIKLGTSNVKRIATSRQTMELIEQMKSSRVQGASVGPNGTWIRASQSRSKFSIVKLTRRHAGGIYSVDHTSHTITLNKDYVVLGDDHATTTGTDGRTVVTITGTSDSPTYVYAYGSTNPLTIAIYPTSVSEFPVHADNQWRRALYESYIQDNAVVLSLILHLGAIDLTAFSA